MSIVPEQSGYHLSPALDQIAVAMNRWYLFFVALLVAGPLWLWTSRLPVTANPGDLSPAPAIGRVAPDFTLQTPDGETVHLAQLRGKPVVINFWATWCGPCQREMPALQTASQHYAGQVAFVGVDQGETAKEVTDFLKPLGVNFTISLDSDVKVGDAYQIQGMPTTFFIDANGVIRELWVGEMNAVILAEGIRKILP
jgi:thiol-disulfide isomerase/thioredoxin